MVSFAEFWDMIDLWFNHSEDKMCVVKKIKEAQRVWVEEQLKQLNINKNEWERVWVNSNEDSDDERSAFIHLDILKGRIEFCEEMLEGLK